LILRDFNMENAVVISDDETVRGQRSRTFSTTAQTS
jgi:hypothetical protein